MASCECGVCLEQYDNCERRPRCLSCGHTLCSACVAAALSRNTDGLVCPFCRLPHASPATAPEDIPINFTVASLLGDAIRTTSTPRAQALLAEIKLEACDLTATHLSACNTFIARLQDFQRRVSETRKIQEMQFTALQTLVQQHRRVLDDLVQVDTHLRDVLERGLEQRNVLEAAQARINACASLLEVTTAHEEGRGRVSSLVEWRKEAQQLLQSQVVVAAKQLERVSGVALHSVIEHNMAEVSAAMAPTKPTPPPPHPLPPPTPTPTQHDEGSHTRRLIREVARRSQVLGSGVWGVSDSEGRPRCACLTLTAQRVYMAALQEGRPPHYSHTIPYEDVRGLVDETCQRLFLEFSWEGQVRGRVCIRLLNVAARARQFLLLCSGEQGPSYRNTRLLEVEGRGQPGERVWGGDYQNNDGSGGVALPGLTRGPLHSHSVIAGLVAGFCYGDEHHKPAHFVIYTKDSPVVYEECPLGRVEEGLEVVRAAAALSDPTAATISNCGIIVSI